MRALSLVILQGNKRGWNGESSRELGVCRADALGIGLDVPSGRPPVSRALALDPSGRPRNAPQAYEVSDCFHEPQ